MNVIVNLRDGTSKTHNGAIFVGEIAQIGELVVGSGFDTGRYPLGDVLDFKGTVNFAKESQSVEEIIRLLQRVR